MADFRFHPTPLAGLEAVSATSAHVFSKHTHDTYGIGFLTAGGQISASGRGQVEAEAGQLITVNPGEVHDGAPLGRTARSWQMLYLTPDLVADSVGDLVSTSSDLEFEFPVFTDPAIRRLLTTLQEQLGTSDRQADAEAFRETLVLLLGKALIRRACPPAPLPASLQQIRQRLDEEPAQSADLQTLAREAGLSRFQLIRAFLRHTGLTPHAYHMQRRALLSRRLLAKGMAPAEVATACGYVDQSHMHREFRRRFGLTPGVYRSAWLSCNPVQDHKL
ncbi:AraC family transcriptional regulator [Rhizobium rosettiformans]|uniref:AraC family transcriptional regulator n=1 Tax=Rhizobium rosettiformans TaxID=1368430 RepID=UPI00285A26C0|nr:AraC family transcriptional regulator [Rhizobium rosettiformans]MDR7029707.1 AraC-like DNA-binding protein [Rhizobium rosettiformans]MDR7063421.1 AraC-like DNA-binding protein [Rhizobium rosettiformans]